VKCEIFASDFSPFTIVGIYYEPNYIATIKRPLRRTLVQMGILLSAL